MIFFESDPIQFNPIGEYFENNGSHGNGLQRSIFGINSS